MLWPTDEEGVLAGSLLESDEDVMVVPVPVDEIVIVLLFPAPLPVDEEAPVDDTVAVWFVD